MRDEELAALAELVIPEAETVEGVLSAATPRTVMVVPSDAVLSDSRGRQCVVAVAEGGNDARPVVVDVVGGVPGVTYLDPKKELAGSTVLANPTSQASGSGC